MKKIGLSFTVLSLCLSCGLQAKEYLGLDLGVQSISGAKSTIKESGGRYDEGYGYKGYTDLESLKILQFDRFTKYGTVKDAWLNFTPDKKLYKISVTWSDTGDTFKLFKDALDSKYGSANRSGSGFKQNYSYKDGSDVEVVLERNTFGFGPDQTTSLKYTFLPVLNDVNNMKSRIEDHIRKENAKKASADL